MRVAGYGVSWQGRETDVWRRVSRSLGGWEQEDYCLAVFVDSSQSTGGGGGIWRALEPLRFLSDLKSIPAVLRIDVSCTALLPAPRTLKSRDAKARARQKKDLAPNLRSRPRDAIASVPVIGKHPSHAYHMAVALRCRKKGKRGIDTHIMVNELAIRSP